MTPLHPKFCPGTRICCPTCAGVLPYFSVHEGHGFYQCSRKVGEGQARKTCSQHVLYYARRRLVAVLTITVEQRTRFDSHVSSMPLDHMLEELGVALVEQDEDEPAPIAA